VYPQIRDEEKTHVVLPEREYRDKVRAMRHIINAEQVQGKVRDVPFSNCEFYKTQSNVTLSSLTHSSTYLIETTYLFLNVKSAVPGCALKLSAAPPTTIVIAEPFPLRKILSQERFETEHTPKSKRISR
jgi:hypothetical protein